jgi:hypothetical protein
MPAPNTFLRHAALEGFTSVAANTTATSLVLKSRKIHVATLEIGGDAANSNGLNFALQSDIRTFMDNVVAEIRVTINGKTQWQGKASEFDQLNGLYGAQYLARTTGAAGNIAARFYLPLIFAQIYRNNNLEVRKGAWNLPKGTPDVMIEVDINTGIVAPVVGGTVEFEPSDDTKGIGAIKKIHRHNLQALGTKGEVDFLKWAGGDYLESAHILPTGDNPARYVQVITIKADGEDIIDGITFQENQDKLIRRQIIPDTSALPRFDWIVDYTDPIDDTILTAAYGKLKAYITWNGAAANNSVVFLQLIGLPE